MYWLREFEYWVYSIHTSVPHKLDRNAKRYSVWMLNEDNEPKHQIQNTFDKMNEKEVKKDFAHYAKVFNTFFDFDNSTGFFRLIWSPSYCHAWVCYVQTAHWIFRLFNLNFSFFFIFWARKLSFVACGRIHIRCVNIQRILLFAGAHWNIQS